MRPEQILNAEGVELLAYWRLAESEPEHAAELLRLLALPRGARVVDLGCGTGRLAELCRRVRPDLHWTLVNVDHWQLAQAPDWAEVVASDMVATGLPAGRADAVVVAYALGYCNPVAVLEEAARLLAPGGQLVLHELYAARHDDQALAREVLGYRLASFPEVSLWAQLVGFDLVAALQDEHRAPGPTVASAFPVFGRFEHNVAVFRLGDRGHAFRGRRAALQFSGGKDSQACLHLLRPFVELGLPVYWTHTGDTIPETVEVVAQARAWVPHFRVIQADVLAWKAAHGMPSDVTTAQSSWIGQQYGMSDIALVGRMECCWHNLMRPMHERMLADDIDLVIRGTKRADTGRVPAVGATEHYEVLLPLLDWSHADVFAYLEQVGAPRSPVYDTFRAISAPECLHCTAWWDDGKAAYLKQRHPGVLPEYRIGLQTIRAELARRMQELDDELSETE